MLKIRPAEKSDYEIFLGISREIQAIHANAEPALFKPAEQFGLSSDEFERLISDPKNVVLLIEKNGVSCGYLYADIIERPENAYAFGFKRMYIHHIGVRAENRGQGLGQALLKEAIRIAKSAKVQRIEVDFWSFNDKARSLFTNFGFKTFNEKLYL